MQIIELDMWDDIKQMAEAADIPFNPEGWRDVRYMLFFDETGEVCCVYIFVNQDIDRGCGMFRPRGGDWDWYIHPTKGYCDRIHKHISKDMPHYGYSYHNGSWHPDNNEPHPLPYRCILRRPNSG